MTPIPDGLENSQSTSPRAQIDRAPCRASGVTCRLSSFNSSCRREALIGRRSVSPANRAIKPALGQLSAASVQILVQRSSSCCGLVRRSERTRRWRTWIRAGEGPHEAPRAAGGSWRVASSDRTEPPSRRDEDRWGLSGETGHLRCHGVEVDEHRRQPVASPELAHGQESSTRIRD